MIRKTSTAEYKTWQKNQSVSDNLPAITTSAVITISELEDFIRQIKPKADCVNVNLIRFTWKKDEPHGIKKKPDGTVFPGCDWNFVPNGKTQVAIAISPATYSESTDLVATGKDITENNQILLLIPGNEGGGPSGHNPPGKGG